MLVGFSALCVQLFKWISFLYLIFFCSCKEINILIIVSVLLGGCT